MTTESDRELLARWRSCADSTGSSYLEYDGRMSLHDIIDAIIRVAIAEEREECLALCGSYPEQCECAERIRARRP